MSRLERGILHVFIKLKAYYVFVLWPSGETGALPSEVIRRQLPPQRGVKNCYLCRKPGHKAAQCAQPPRLQEKVAGAAALWARTLAALISSELLVNLPPHEIGRMICPLSEAHSKTLQKSDLTIQDKAKAEYEKRSHHAEERKQAKPTLWFNSYFTKFHKLCAATVISGTLDFAKRYHLDLTDDEMRNDKDCHGQDR